MFMLHWTENDRTHTCCCADNETAWIIYWSLKKRLESTRPTCDCKLWITTGAGIHLDPTKGGGLPMKDNSDPVILKAGCE